MSTSRIHRVSVADQVASAVRKSILDGELRPGAQLTEAPLAASLGVSRNTMREAMRILILEGLLVRSVHRGVAVSRLSLRDVKEIYNIRRVLELPAVMIARHAPPEIKLHLRSALESYEATLRAKDFVGAVEFDLAFHSALIRFYRNQRLETFYQNVIGELRLGMVLVDRRHDDPIALIPIHRKIFQYLDSGKLKECAALLAQHLQDSEARLTQVMTAAASEEGNEFGRKKSRAG